MLLVRRLGGSLEEQAAALLHDVSHTAFSHVIDYVFDGHHSQSYHEEQKEAFMAASDLPQVLERHGMDWRLFLHEEDYPLLEQPAPALCADRLDYFLRDSLDLGLSTPAQIQAALASLRVWDGRIVTADVEAARWMGETFILADQASWANFREVGLYELAARAIRRALALGALSEADLWTTDAQAWARLSACPDAELQSMASLVSLETRFEWDAHVPTFWVGAKLRTIDPPVLVNGAVHPLSTLDPAFAARRRAYLEKNSGKWPMRVIRSV
jgi:HD superfamily phosphohydrolase